jgi:hypothetical protein
MTKDRKCSTCGADIYRDNLTGQCRICLNAKIRSGSPTEQLTADRERQRLTTEVNSLRARYQESLKTIERQDRELRLVTEMDTSTEPFIIEPAAGKHTSEGTAVLVASDWHIEENVGSEVGGLNRFNIEIAQERATTFFRAGLRLVKLLQQDITIKTVVLACLGDYITNDIHEGENSEVNELQPMHAIVLAQNMLISGIEFILANSEVNLVVPCHSGNHARTTHRTRFTTENGHSLEYLMFLHLQAYFRGEKRVQFLVSESYHSYLDIYGKIIRFHHGHAIKYQGGIGGIFIPAYKAVSQWNKGRQADLDVFGHFHQLRDGGNFICNGSLIGYNAFALSIKADFEAPKQALFLIDKKRGRTCTWPILL